MQPVSTAYVGAHGIPMGRENRPLYAWYGDMELVPHLWEALKAGPLDVVVQFHPPSCDGHGPQGTCAAGRGHGAAKARPDCASWQSLPI